MPLPQCLSQCTPHAFSQLILHWLSTMCKNAIENLAQSTVFHFMFRDCPMHDSVRTTLAKQKITYKLVWNVHVANYDACFFCTFHVEKTGENCTCQARKTQKRGTESHMFGMSFIMRIYPGLRLCLSLTRDNTKRTKWYRICVWQTMMQAHMHANKLLAGRGLNVVFTWRTTFPWIWPPVCGVDLAPNLISPILL